MKSEQKITVEKQPRRGFGERNWGEVVRLAIALMVALIGLLAGAQEQLAKLDIVPAAIAVFLLGFGAVHDQEPTKPEAATTKMSAMARRLNGLGQQQPYQRKGQSDFLWASGEV